MALMQPEGGTYPVVSSQISVSLIVLNWNGLHHLRRCLPSLLQQNYDGFDIVLVDNGSTDGSADYVASEYPGVRLLRAGSNLGYAGGMNLGIARTNADVVVLLNDDIIAPSCWLRELMEGLLSDARIGVAGCKLYYADGATLQHAGGFVSHPRATTGHYGYATHDEGLFDSQADVDYVTGAAMAVRRTLLEEIGDLDRGYWFYYEDVDLCYRARDAGWRVVYLPRANLIHLESASIVRNSPSYLRAIHMGRLRFILKRTTREQFVDEFLPAELAWLENDVAPPERQIVGSAYKLSILTASAVRVQYADGCARPDELQCINSGLKALWRRARALR